MSIAESPPYHRITINRLADKTPITQVAAWCLENEIKFAVDYSKSNFDVTIILEADAATLVKLKFKL